MADPRDPVPYWLVSTRRPRRLAAALGEAPGPEEVVTEEVVTEEVVTEAVVTDEGPRASR